MESRLEKLRLSVEELGSVLLREDDVDDVARRISDLATSAVEGADAAGLSLVTDEGIQTFGPTDPVVNDVDQVQYQLREGPCYSAIVKPGLYRVDDLGADTQWPAFSKAAVDKGVRSMLAFVVAVGDSWGALNLFARETKVFTKEDEQYGVILAAMSSAVLTKTVDSRVAENRLAQMSRALDSRTMIGAATGILMEREKISQEDAFGLLVQASQHLNVKLRDVAQQLVSSAAPEGGEQAAAEPGD